ncbi:glycoside hydrolase family 44 protein [Brevibacillus dissolubilis]|uniref:glycoside hydrolase family 44 protein n=1 Tax=Brevibacillus dissolubilis TaxID=1844116 RepID=UPI001117951D|nr:glycoside hydrolase family 44 protein [Brevibacillus dissolubilis]
MSFASPSKGRRWLAFVTACLLMLNTFSLIGPADIARAEATVLASSAQATPSTVTQGSGTDLDVQVTMSEAASLLIDLEIFDPSLKRVHQSFIDNVNVNANEAKSIPFKWNVPTNLPEGKYTVSVGIFGAGWSKQYKWHAGATFIQVEKAVPTIKFVSSAATTPQQVLPGGTVHVDTTVTADLGTDTAVDISVLQPNGANVLTEEFTATFTTSETKHLEFDWAVPADAELGTYRVVVDVHNPDRTQSYHQNVSAGEFQVVSSEQPALAVPANLKAVPTDSSITLSWDGVTSATGYDVEVDGAVVGVTGTSYTHNGLQPDTTHTYKVRAKNASVTGAWSSAITAKTNASSTSPTKVKVSVETGTDATTAQAEPNIEITNVSNAPINLQDVKARYYFTIDEEKPVSVNFWSTKAKEVVIAKIVKMPIPSATADHYMEIGFTDQAGALQPGAMVGVYTWFYFSDYSSKFTQTNDYSFINSNEEVFSEKVTGYVGGTLDWGTEPELFDMPAFPLNLAAVPTDTTISLTWDQVAGATGYDIWADGKIITDIRANTYLVQWLNPGTRHSYKVRTRQGESLSVWSSEIQLKTTGQQQLPAPSNVRATATADTITVTWDKLQEEITGYDIEVDGNVIDAQTNLSYTHSNLVSGSQHTYRVRAKDGSTAGQWSDLLKVNTKYEPTGPFQVNFTIDPTADRAPISPYIYGTNDDLSGTENWTARRLGGNRLSTYNWENNASNAGEDYFNMSDNYIPWYYGGVPWGGNMADPGIGVAGFHQKSLAKGALTLTTLQTAGFVAKDTNGQVNATETAPSNRWVEVKAAKNAPFSTTPDLTDNYVYMDEFVNLMIHKFGSAATPTGIKAYEIDNEPGLWENTHPYMHPQKPGSEEVLNKSIDLAKAVKNVDPDAQLFGPVTYGFSDMYDMDGSADWKDVKGNYDWYIDYYLDNLRVASLQEGKRLLDAVDIHWYPEISAGGVRITDSNSNDNIAANKARIQAPRSLWDSSYKEDSWIGQWYSSYLPVIPRLQQSIDTYNQGTKIAFTEYNYGGENHISGGIATADVLGIFGKEGVYLGTYWKMVNGLKEAPYHSAAFKMFTNYDGNNATFGDTKVKAETTDIENSSIYGSVFQDSDNNLHLIVINKNYDHEMNAVLNIGGTTNYTSARVFGFDSNSAVITEREPITNITNNTITYTIPKLTVCHFVLKAGSAE